MNTNFGKFNCVLALALGSFALGSLVGSSALAAGSRVSFVRECTGKDQGTWNWGEAPSGCDAFRFGDVSKIKFIYGDFTFDRTQKDNDEHRKDYVTNLNALIRDLASSYIRSRRPDVKDDEVEAFARAIHTVAHQETFWSHYRVGQDGQFKLMTGDKNVSHGIMQINQRYHASKDQDRSFDLVGNLSFGIEHYYKQWESASSARCIIRSNKQSRAQTLENITRSAYSSYNGGGDAICRWTNPNHPWAKNDGKVIKSGGKTTYLGFFGKWSEQAWGEWIRDPNQKLGLDLECIRSGDELCAVAKERQGEYLASRPLLLEDGSTCFTVDGKTLECSQDTRVFDCLAGLKPEILTATPLKVSDDDSQVQNMKRNFHEDRVTMCKSAHPEMAGIGDYVTAKLSLKVQAEIGGRTVGFIKPGQSFQVLDMEVEPGKLALRQYRIRLANGSEGWVAAGDQATQSKFVSVISSASNGLNAQALIPKLGGTVEVVKADGIKVLVSPASTGAGGTIDIKGIAAKGTTLKVEEVKIMGAANEVWLRVQLADDVGYVFAGRTYPTTTLDQWVKVK